jgi:hypothetical protein
MNFTGARFFSPSWLAPALALLSTFYLPAQTQVPVLVPHTTLHDHYLFNRSFTYDGQDYTGLPWMFYYVNVGSSPPPATLRTRCVLEAVNGAPYDHANFSWFRFPAPPGGPWPPADGTEPLAATGEYLETAQFGPVNGVNPAGFVFTGEFGGETNPPSAREEQSHHYFLESVYFTDRECSDAGAEYGWYRIVADTETGDTPANSVAFYYATFSNCNDDYGCWDVLGHQVQQTFLTTAITNVAPNSAGVYQYEYHAVRNGSFFDLAVLDPASGDPVTCKWSFPTGSGSGTCQFSVPIEGFYPSAEQIDKGYIVVATQSSRLYPAMTGAPYPEWYDYTPQKLGGAPPTNIVPTSEPNGSKSCITAGAGYACLKALSLAVLYQ